MTPILSDLISRVKAATAGGRALDCAVGCIAGVISFGPRPITEWNTGPLADGWSWLPLEVSQDERRVVAKVEGPEGEVELLYSGEPDNFTSSLDAITDLIERRLPNARWWLQRGLDSGVAMSMCTIGEWNSQFGHTPALAACAALLDAIQATKEHGHEG
jgi:hypothetical protein